MSGKLSDSPWFWLLLFGAAAVAALAAIGPKHVRRQERLVRMQAARERMQSAAAKSAAGGDPAVAIEDAEPLPIEPPHVSVQPLMMVLASVLLVAAFVAGWVQVRKPPTPQGEPPSEVRE